MSEPYRGFHELPLAVFEALQEVAEAVVTGAVKQASAAMGKPKHLSPIGRVLQPAFQRALLERVRSGGFEEINTIHPSLVDAIAIRARHQCGAWAEVKLYSEFLWSTHSLPQSIIEAADSLACYCVQRDAMPTHTAVVASVRAAEAARMRPVQLLMAATTIASLAAEAGVLASDVKHVDGVPVLLDPWHPAHGWSLRSVTP